MERKINSIRGRKMAGPLACPHCRSGRDGLTLGLYWEAGERCWRCVICGYRLFAQPLHA